MGFCVPTNVIPNWKLVLVVLVELGSIFGSLTVKVDTIFFFFISAARARGSSRASEALFNGRLWMSSAAKH